MATKTGDVTFTRPLRRIFTMIAFLAVVGAVVGYLFQEIERVFLSNPELNGLIVLVFVIGVFVAFWHVFRLFSAVNWIEALAVRQRGIENTSPPSLLVAMDPMRKDLSPRGPLASLNTSTSRSILDSISTRIDESRDTLRYLSGLLIFLGLLGTFWGLAKTVPAVVDTIRAIQPQAGEEGVALFEKLMSGLDAQLAGMGVAFASSLLGLAGSLIVGFLELMSAGAQNRFYGELETFLSARTRITGNDTDDSSTSIGDTGDLADRLGAVGQQIAALNRLLMDAEDRRAEDSEQMIGFARGVESLASEAAAEREAMRQAFEDQARLAAAIERLAEVGGGGVAGEGMDSETRRHIRNIDILLAKLLEENAAGRVETAEALRRELRSVGRAVGDVTAAITGGAPAR